MNTKRESNRVIISASVLILDIEGTTSSISFVKDELFPYVRNNLEAYIDKNWDTESFKELLTSLKTQAQEDEVNNLEGLIKFPECEEKDLLKKATVDNVLWQMDSDRKTKGLKDLQGVIMEDGFKKGDLKGHVYDDVEPCLKEWCQQDKQVYIYSSGSVHAQKLLFGHSVKGDLLPLVKGHFDTSVGMKGDPASYKKILSEISCNPGDVAFLTDVPKEAKAAKEAGISAILLSRDGNVPLTEAEIKEFPVIYSFVEIEFEHINKKRKICSENDVNNENKIIPKCEVVSLKEDSKPNNPKLTANNDNEVMEVEESSEESRAKQIDEKSDCVEVSQNSSDETHNKAGIEECDKAKDEASNEPALSDLSNKSSIEKKNIETIEDTIPNALEATVKHSKAECQTNNIEETKNNAEEIKSEDIKDKLTEMEGANDISAKSKINLNGTIDEECVSKDTVDEAIQDKENSIDDKEENPSNGMKEVSEIPVDNESQISKEGSIDVTLSKCETEVPVECDTTIKPETCEIIEINKTTNGIDCPKDNIPADHLLTKCNTNQETCEAIKNDNSSDESSSTKTKEIETSNTSSTHGEMNNKTDIKDTELNSLDSEMNPNENAENSVSVVKPDILPKDFKNNNDLAKEKEPSNSQNNIEEKSYENVNKEDYNPEVKDDSKEVPETCEEKENLINDTNKTCDDSGKGIRTNSQGENIGDKTETAEAREHVNSASNVDISSKNTDCKTDDDISELSQSEGKEKKLVEVINNGKLTNEDDNTVNGISSPIPNGTSTEAKKLDDSNESQIKTVVEA